MPDEQRFLLAVAHQAGPDTRITKGMDGRRDYFTPAELEKACWSFLPNGAKSGLFHGPDDTIGHVQVVESYIYRGPDWLMKAVDGTEQTVKQGDWLIGLKCDDTAWRLYKTGQVAGVSIQGAAKRRSAA